MSVFGIAMVRDESDVIARVIAHMLSQVDHVLVADNGSVDGTRQHLDQIAGVTVIPDGEPGYYQSRKMSALAAQAAQMGADWVVPFDADEIWLAPTGRLADVLADLPGDIMLAEATLFDHVATALDDDEEGDHVRRIKWRRQLPVPMRKVACRAVREGLSIAQGNHSASYVGIRHAPAAMDLLTVHHYPYRSVPQMIRKARNGAEAYAATDLPEDVGKHWRDYGRLSDSQIAEVFRDYFWSANPAADGLVEDQPCE